MVWKLVRIVMALLVVLVGTALSYVLIVLPKAAPPRTGNVDRSAARVERGKYLFEVTNGCAYCHSTHDQKRFGYPIEAGGYAKGNVLPDESGGSMQLVAVNLTSDPQTGVGNVSDGQLIRAIREGIGRDERPLFPQMPYLEYANLSDEDVEALVAYIRTIPPVNNPLPKSKIGFPMSLIMRMLPKPVGAVPAVNRADLVNYGKYLTRVSGCQFCHTPFVRGQPVEAKLFAGGHLFVLAPNARVVSPNLTPDPNTGIGTVTEEQFLEKFYQYKDYIANGSPAIKPELNTSMPWLGLARMEPGDLKAVYAYLRTVPAVANAVVTHPDSPDEKDQRK